MEGLGRMGSTQQRMLALPTEEIRATPTEFIAKNAEHLFTHMYL